MVEVLISSLLFFGMTAASAHNLPVDAFHFVKGKAIDLSPDPITEKIVKFSHK